MDAGWKGMLGYKGTIETVHANGTYTVKVSPAYTMKDVEKNDIALFAKHPTSATQGSKVIYKGPIGDNLIPDEAYLVGEVLSSVGTKATVPKDPTDSNSTYMLINLETDAWVLLSE